MALVLNEDEIMMRDTAEGFFADRAPVTALRKLRDSESAEGFDPALWNEMGEMGFAGILVDEDHGGVGMGFVTAGLVAEQMGANLSASPYFSTSVLAATALAHGSDVQKKQYLPKVAQAKTILALALDEGAKHNPERITTRAEASGNGFKISGEKAMVVDGHMADTLIVAARTSGEDADTDGVSLFLVDAKSDGVEVERTHMVDSRNAARITLNAVEVSGDALLGPVDGGREIIEATLAAGRAVAAAELLGAGQAAFNSTVEYLKGRKQFGTEIGRFQALQHRASHLYSEMEIARSAVLAALTALDENDPQAHAYAMMAKAKLGEVAKLAGLEGVQMHGGVGMTDEYDIGLYLKRIRVLQELLGDANFQGDRLAKARGY
jgi:acyl-CoA dehydrogenase